MLRSDNCTTTTSCVCVDESLGNFRRATGFGSGSGSGSGVGSSSDIGTVSVVLCYEVTFFLLEQAFTIKFRNNISPQFSFLLS